MQNKYLYIFLHIPKTAGSTFAGHLEKNFPKENLLRLYGKKTCEKWMNGIESIPEEQKNRIQCIYGHRAYYGIHRYFKKKARYITFFRSPLNRAISYYNFHQTRLFITKKKYKLNSAIFDKIIHLKEKDFFNYFESKYTIEKFDIDLLFRYRKIALNNFKFDSFEDWVANQKESLYGKDNHNEGTGQSLLQLLETRKYVAPDKRSESDLIELCKKFYFIGTTENYAEDALFLYHLLGFKNFIFNKNISRKFYSKSNTQTEDQLLEKLSSDVKLYETACKTNIYFKTTHPNFQSIIKKTKYRRLLSLPLPFILNCGSFLLKKMKLINNDTCFIKPK